MVNALAIQAIQRDGRIPIAASANCLQPDGQNDNDWDQGLLFLNPWQVWLQPPGDVTRMISRHYQPCLIQADVEGPQGGLDVVATRSDDGRTLVVQVVNAGDQPVPAIIRFDGFGPARPGAAVEQLEGPLDARNTADDPVRVAPPSETWLHHCADGVVQRLFTPRSYTVLRFE